MLRRVMCGTCQLGVNRFSAFSAHSGSGRFVTGQLSSKSADFSGRHQANGNAELSDWLKFSLWSHILCIGQQGIVGVSSQNFRNYDGTFKGTLAKQPSDTRHFQPKFILHLMVPKITEVNINNAITQSKVKKLSSHSHLVYIKSLTDIWVQANPSKFVLALIQ